MNNCNCQPNNKPSLARPTPYNIPCPASNQELAMAYVPWQYFKNLYEPDQALRCGTIFQDLYKPFYGSMGGRS